MGRISEQPTRVLVTRRGCFDFGVCNANYGNEIVANPFPHSFPPLVFVYDEEPKYSRLKRQGTSIRVTNADEKGGISKTYAVC